MSTSEINQLKIDRAAFTPQPRAKRRWWIAGAIFVCIVVVAMIFYPRPIAVQATSILTRYPSDRFIVLNASGYVVAQRKAAVSTKASGRLEWLGVQEGSRVKAGELLARLDARDVRAQRDSAQASLAVAQATLASAQAEARDAAQNLRRNQDLAAQGFISPASIDSARARDEQARAAVVNTSAAIAVAQANLRNAQIALDFTDIRAPFDGVVLSKNANIGDMVTPFSSALDSKGAVVSMADLSTLEVEADVSEASLSKIQVNQAVEITLDALPDQRFSGSVSRMVPTIDRSKATLMTKIRFAKLDARILPDMSAKVSFLSQQVAEAEQKPLLVVAQDALSERDGKKMLFRIVDEKGAAHVQAILVTTGIAVNDLIEIRTSSLPLQSGDKIVAKPGSKLQDKFAVSLQVKS